MEDQMPKHSGKWVSYLRVSTDKQGRSGLGIEAQRQAVLDYLNGGKWKLTAEYVEHESSRRSDRPELAKAIAACKKHKATLIIARLDRLARNVAFISNLMERKVAFVACDMPEATPMMLHIYAAVAEQTARNISEQTKAALQAAKDRGVKLGAPKHALAKARVLGNAGNRKAADRFAANVKPIIEQVKASGATSLRAIAAALTARGIKTARGGAWDAATVANVMRRVP
jgi:DNA invertase Pin-like site-specific DNA recombinase